MGHQNQRNAQFMAYLTQQSQHLTSRLTIQIAGGFVSKQDRRLVCQCAGDGHALLLTTGHSTRQMGQTVADAQHIDDLIEVSFVSLASIQHYGQQDILPAGQFTHQIVALKHKAKTAAAQHSQLIILILVQIGILIDHLASGRMIQTRKQMQQCGLAAAAGAGDGSKATLLNRQRYIVKGIYLVFTRAGLIYLAESFTADDLHIVYLHVQSAAIADWIILHIYRTSPTLRSGDFYLTIS